MRGSTAGVQEQLKGPRRHYALLSALDAALSALVVAPAVVAYWRGTWGLMDRHAPWWWASFALGTLGHGAFTLLQAPLARLLHPDRRRLCYYAGSRLYTALYGFACVNAWRGAWKWLDLYADAVPLAASLAVAAAALAALRALRNVSAPPFAVILDHCDGYFLVPTMFRVQSQKHGVLYVLDCLFSILIIGNLVVVVWRGFWTLLDIYLFPGRDDWSAFASLGIGYAIVVVAFGLQTPLKIVCSKVSGLPRLAVLDVYLFFAFCGTVNVWRGVWNLLNIYFLPESPELSLWLSHAGALALLMLLNCSNSVLVRGVFVDGEEEGGKCAVFPCYYLRLFFQERRLEKLARAHKAACNNANHAAALASLMDNPESTL